MRLLGVTVASLTMLCVLCVPALAQSAPSASQYEPGTCPPGSPGSLCAQSSLGDGADDFSENAGEGADAVNEALEEPEASTAASTVPAVASAPANSASPEDGSAAESTGVPGGITALPETGGAPLTVLGSGILLVVLGLMARKVVGR